MLRIRIALQRSMLELALQRFLWVGYLWVLKPLCPLFAAKAFEIFVFKILFPLSKFDPSPSGFADFDPRGGFVELDDGRRGFIPVALEPHEVVELLGQVSEQ